ncbi:MAG: thioredoxin domain-containing protein [Candidatus Cyclobacteriaceae bacterium M3_2C_046]
MNTSRKPNQLINQSSPYLLQHAYNPVNWYPWSREALDKARQQDKPIIVSVGYSACHWCHVMEKESFENEEVAKIMNEHFVCIKVDREERPDVDQIYMDAVQLMGINGGWPLNVFLTADQKPFYGGTYFPTRSWLQLLNNVSQAYKQQNQEIKESAEKFVQAISVSDIVKYDLQNPLSEFKQDDLDQIYQTFSAKFDRERGGMNRAPKFPMPSYWLFGLRYFALTQNESVLTQVNLTLKEMAKGGIYDQIGGGFARYSVDAYWFVPHFEKMLYDNGQLVSLYAEAYSATGDPHFKQVVYQTIDFVARELTNSDGGFYAALDADSEGEEGKYYVWDTSEFLTVVSEVLPEENALLIAQFYHLTQEGNWEPGKNILLRKQDPDEFAREHDLEPTSFKNNLQKANKALIAYRQKRVKPGLDDKILAGWNALMLRGLVNAYQVFAEPDFIQMALKNAEFLVNNLMKGPQLYRNIKNDQLGVIAYLEDYALLILAFTDLYQATFEEKWLQKADQLMTYVLSHFYDEKEHLFYFTDSSSDALIARKKEIFDNVIPASNSVMAHALYQLGILLENDHYTQMSLKMIKQMGKLLLEDPQYLSNWASLFTLLVQPTAEVALIGSDINALKHQFYQQYWPNKILAGTYTTSQLPLLKERSAINGQDTIYVCFNKTCQLPVHTVEEAWKQILRS